MSVTTIAASDAFNEALQRHARGDMSGALAVLRTLLSYEPDNLPALRVCARFCLDAQRLEEACSAANQLLRQSPEDGIGLMVLARAAMRLRRRDAQAEKRLSVRAKTDAEAAFGLSLLAMELHDSASALDHLGAALTLDPGHAAARGLRASTRDRLGDRAGAMRDYEKVLSQDGANVRANLGLARLRSKLGQFDQAQDGFRKVLARAPEYSPAIAGLLSARPKDGAHLAAKAETLAGNLKLPQHCRIELLYAAAKEFERQGEHARARPLAEEANNLQAAVHPYDAAALAGEQEKALAFFNAERLAASKDRRVAGPAPILICGLPRSGTTLMESILSRHSQIAAGGEITFLRGAQQWFAEQDDLEAALSAHKNTFAEEYRKRLARGDHDKAFVTDKFPDNWRRLGLAAELMGDIRIIRMVRDPRDVAVSVFFEHFAASETFAHSIKDFADFAHMEQQSSEAWAARLPRPPVTVVYEELVSNPEAQIRKLFDAIDLPFEPDCLEPHTNSSAFATPSKWQVRQPINTKAIGRWRQHKDLLSCALNDLTKLSATVPRRNHI